MATGCLPILDMRRFLFLFGPAYQTRASTSPPTPCLRA
jgi:hypothetical protein